jgi:hypothetical protein
MRRGDHSAARLKIEQARLEQAQRMRAIFGLAPAETAQTIHPSGGAATTTSNGDQGGSSAIESNHGETWAAFNRSKEMNANHASRVTPRFCHLTR